MPESWGTEEALAPKGREAVTPRWRKMKDFWVVELRTEWRITALQGLGICVGEDGF